MKIKSGVRIAGFFLLAGSLTLGGCGYKGQPVPPDSVVPEPVDDLRYSVDESGLTLTWSYPTKNISGDAIEEISSFDLFRAVVPLEDYCATCPIPFGEAMEMPGGVTTDQAEGVRLATYESALLRSGHKYFFKVRSRTSWWADSADSNVVSFVWHVPAKAPAQLMAEAKDNLISLAWQPVTSMVDEKEIGDIAMTYQVMRSESGDKFANIGKPSVETVFVDRQVINGKKYFYKVQAVMNIEGNTVPGGISEVVDAKPVDMTPPVVPVGVTAIQSASDIKVIWNKSTDKDLGGYRVYRRFADEDKPTLIGEVKPIYTLFVDKNVPTGKRVYYSVSAIDSAERPNESVLSREATIRD